MDVLAIPPKGKCDLTPPDKLARRLRCLIDQSFPLSGKTRTDGSKLRKLVAETLAKGQLPPPAGDADWRPVPPKGKGVPRLLREFIDTYIVTSGDSYNLQVWNRNPAEPLPQIEYSDGSQMLANEVRFVFVRVDPEKQLIRSVIVATPDYIVDHFGKFGKPTVKEQLIITDSARKQICSQRPPLLFYPDCGPMAEKMVTSADLASHRIHEEPSPGTTLRLSVIRDFVCSRLLGQEIKPQATKNRGQELERMVAVGLGYRVSDQDVLAGGYPDLRHQALEVKVQDSPTVDLGRYSPQFEEDVPDCPGFTTQSIRYLIALLDPKTNVCIAAVVCPGKCLGKHFVYVADRSFKCQRSIPMAFFDKFDGKAVFNPRYP